MTRTEAKAKSIAYNRKLPDDSNVRAEVFTDYAGPDGYRIYVVEIETGAILRMVQ